jgi:hypothetical protein
MEIDKYVKTEGDKILEEYEKGVDEAISANTNTMNNALDQIGEMGADGRWTAGTPTSALMNAQNAKSEFAIQEIQQQKEQAKKDYIKEQSAAYTDWQKQSSKHGVVAEQLAANGMSTTGYAESSQVMMYNQYQARVTAARESFMQISKEYDTAIASARLQNSSALAQIAADAMAQRLQTMLQFTMKNNELLLTKTQQTTSLKQQNLDRYLSVYNQIVGAENAGGSTTYAPVVSGYAPTSVNRNTGLPGTGSPLATLREQSAQNQYNSAAQNTDFKTYEQTLEWLRARGLLSEDDNGGLMTAEEFVKSKGNYPATISSYEVYLKEFVQYLIKNMQ